MLEDARGLLSLFFQKHSLLGTPTYEAAHIKKTITHENVQVLSFANWFLKAIGKTENSMKELVQEMDGSLKESENFWLTFRCSFPASVHWIKHNKLLEAFLLCWLAISS